MILVCDVCGEPATSTVAIRANGKSLNKDLCRKHLDELTSGSRPARRGRPRKTAVQQPVRRRRTAAKSTATSKATSKATAKRRGRRRAPAAEPAPAQA